MSAKMSNAFKIIALSAGMSENSTTTRLAREIAQGAAAAVGADVEILELCPYARDVAEAMVTGFPSERLERILHSVETADALVVGTPVYNAMPSGLFVEFFDVLPEGALSGTPVAIAATGGTPRHSLVTEQIRPMLVYLHALVPTTSAYAATEDWGAPGIGYDGRKGSSLLARIRRESRELTALIRSAAGGEVAESAMPSASAKSVERIEPGSSAVTFPLAEAFEKAASSESSASAAQRDATEEFPNFVPFDLLR